MSSSGGPGPHARVSSRLSMRLSSKLKLGRLMKAEQSRDYSPPTPPLLSQATRPLEKSERTLPPSSSTYAANHSKTGPPEKPRYGPCASSRPSILQVSSSKSARSAQHMKPKVSEPQFESTSSMLADTPQHPQQEGHSRTYRNRKCRYSKYKLPQVDESSFHLFPQTDKRTSGLINLNPAEWHSYLKQQKMAQLVSEPFAVPRVLPPKGGDVSTFDKCPSTSTLGSSYGSPTTWSTKLVPDEEEHKLKFRSLTPPQRTQKVPAFHRDTEARSQFHTVDPPAAQYNSGTQGLLISPSPPKPVATSSLSPNVTEMSRENIVAYREAMGRLDEVRRLQIEALQARVVELEARERLYHEQSDRTSPPLVLTDRIQGLPRILPIVPIT